VNKYIHLLLLLIVSNLSFTQENSLHNRRKNTLVDFGEITNYYEGTNSENGSSIDVQTFTSAFGYMLLVESADKKRKIDNEKLELLDLIFKSIKIPQKASDIFEHEAFIQTDNGNYWLPIQNELLGFWEKEMKKNKKALIFIRAFGSTNDAKENKFLFTINSFNANYYDGLWEQALSSFNDEDYSNGKTCLTKLIEINPKDGRNFSMFGYYYYNQGYPDNKSLLVKADSLYNISEKLSPDYSYGYYQRSLVKFQLGEYEQAWDAIEKARSLGEKGIEDFILERFESKLPYAEYLKLKKQPHCP
jgi:hypothetical protein